MNEAMADRSAEMARKVKLEVDRLRYLSITDAISTRSRELNNNKELAALLAVQAYNFNSSYYGYEYNNNVYGGLVDALKRYDSLPINLNNSRAPSAFLPSSKTDSVRIGKDLIKADTNGDVIILTNGIVRKKLVWHQTRVEHIGISPSRKFMVTVSKDMTICIWNLADLTKQPLVIKESGSIDSIAFSSDETQIIVRVRKQESLIHFWPLNMMTMAQKLCSCIERNMSLEDWEQYIGHDNHQGVPYQSTCSQFPPRK